MRTRQIIGIVVGLALGAMATPAGAGTFNSGSTGANGAFPPSPPATYTEMQLDLKAGNVKYYNGATLVSTVAIAGGASGFPTGILNFTTVAIPTGKTLKFLRNATNTAVTMLASGAVTIDGTISLDGGAGRDSATSIIYPSAGAGGPGGFDGGAGGSGAPVGSGTGGTGLGPGGGTGGTGGVNLTCHGAGGGFGTAGPSTSGGTCPTAAGGAPYGNPQLLPLVGGAGGGAGGCDSRLPYTGGGGGGGGGAILIASSGTLTLRGSVTARGGNGGAVQGSWGGGGAGGAVRLVATTLTGSGGSILVTGGSGWSGPAGSGRVRLEAYTNTLSVTVPSAIASVDVPRAVFPSGFAALTITSVAGRAAPANPVGSFSAVDVTLPSSATSPVRVVVTAANVPDGTPVLLKAKPLGGPITSVTTPGLAAGTAQADLPIDLSQPNVVTAEATFLLAGLFDAPIQYAGEDVTTATVMASLGAGSHVRYYTASGQEVPEHAALALGLPR